MKKNNKHLKNKKLFTIDNFLIFITILFFLSAFFSLWLYCKTFSNFHINNILHLFDYISEDNEDWDTFSFLIAGVLDGVFSGITLFVLMIEHFRNKRDKIAENIERDKIEKDKLTNRYVLEMEKLNQKFFDIRQKNNEKQISISSFFERQNRLIEKLIYSELFLESLIYISKDKYPILSSLFPFHTDVFSGKFEDITFEKMITPKNVPKIRQWFINELNLSESIKTEILNNSRSVIDNFISNYGDLRKTIISDFLPSNKSSYNEIIYLIIENFIFAMKSIGNYQDGINYYFLQIPKEERYFFLFISSGVDLFKKILIAIRETTITEDYNEYSFVQELENKLFFRDSITIKPLL